MSLAKIDFYDKILESSYGYVVDENNDTVEIPLLRLKVIHQGDPHQVILHQIAKDGTGIEQAVFNPNFPRCVEIHQRPGVRVTIYHL